MIKYVCDDTEKFLDELLVVQRAVEKELREVMTKFRNLPECGDKEFGKYSSDIWRITNDYQKVINLERDVKKAPVVLYLHLGLFINLQNITRTWKGFLSVSTASAKYFEVAKAVSKLSDFKGEKI